MNGQWIYHYRGTLLGSQVAEPFDEDKIDYGLVVGEPRIYRDVHIVGLHRYRRRDHTVEGWEHLLVRLRREYLSWCLLAEICLAERGGCYCWLCVLSRHLGILVGSEILMMRHGDLGGSGFPVPQRCLVRILVMAVRIAKALPLRASASQSASRHQTWLRCSCRHLVTKVC